MNFIELKPLSENLLADVVALDRLALGGLWSLDGYQRELSSPNSDIFALTSPDISVPLLGLGCLWAILDEAHITVLAVHPSYQRQGLGQTLLVALLASARKRGLEWATLEARPSNAGALQLYRKYGFEEVGRRKRYYADTGEDALILWRKGLHQREFAEVLLAWKTEVADRLQRSNWQLKSWS